MGMLIDGAWRTDRDLAGGGGAFERAESTRRNWITADGRAGPTGEGGFAAASGRYHLYVSHACPWAHRTVIFRKLKQLSGHIGVDVVHPLMGEDGWELRGDGNGATGDSLHGASHLRDIYLRDDPKATGRVTVPVLWDKERGRIVSNESSEIVRMFNSAFDEVTGNTDDYRPEELRAGIDEINGRVYHGLNNGVYKCGFATRQDAYDKAAAEVFDTLDWLESLLGERRYLVGDRVTEADWRLATTLFRFDPVYHTHFKCNRNFLRDFPNLWAYARELYQWRTPEGPVSETVNFEHIVDHYHRSHRSVNPHGIVPINPVLEWNEPHGR